LDAKVDEAFTVYELCREVYGASAKKHRVAVIRAAKGLLKTRPDLGCLGCSGFGFAFFHQSSVMSYARARLKASGRWAGDIDARLAPGGDEYEKVAEGGAWWLRVQKWIAHQANDVARLEELKLMPDTEEQERAAIMAMLFRR
jgi:hypothetical protein